MSRNANYRLIHTLAEAHVRQLCALYDGEWWTQARGIDEVRTMLAHSDIVFGLCEGATGALVAFARVLTDRAFKAIVFDVIVAPAHRNFGLGRRLMDSIVEHPDLSGVQHVELYCRPELVPFYERWGFSIDLSGIQRMRRTLE